MSSWSGSHQPSRRSRSRSPGRGYGRPYPDQPGYPSDPYRMDYDSFGRDRSYGDWERDRSGYDYGRRGRSRSPYDEGSRKRRRSPSPYDRERHEPRPRYNDDYDAHSRSYDGRSSSRYPPPYPGRGRGPPDPRSLDYPASLKQYADWFRYNYPQQAAEEDQADKAAEQEAGDGSKPRNGIRAKWEKYKKEFTANQLQTLFDHHRKSPWFGEKYDPSTELANLRSRVRKIGWNGRLEQFLVDLENGKCDPNVSEPEPFSPPKETKEDVVPPENGTIDPDVSMKKDEDEFVPDAEDEANDQEQDMNKPEVNGKSTSDRKNSSRAEEVSVEPEDNQVMIRTIPPDIGRVKLESIMTDIEGFVYLALGDPMQKRNYYRAGWIRFQPDADMSTVISTLSERKIDGFKLHVSHYTRPFTSKVRVTPEIASRPDRIVKDLKQAKELAIILEDDREKLQKFVPTKDTEGNGDSATQNGQQPVSDVADVNNEFKEKGSDVVERRIAKLTAELSEDLDDFENKKNTLALDLYLAYLRSAFHCCYYCVFVCDHAEEMHRKCIKHVRKPLSKVRAKIPAEPPAEVKDEEKDSADGPKEKEKDNAKSGDGKEWGWKRHDERWSEWLDNKVALLINRDGIDVHEYGGKDYSEELTKVVEPYIKQEEEGRYRCKTCTKLFKATAFVEKHIANKHSELVTALEEIPYFNNFVLDPQRIQPFTHPPPTTGQAPPPQAYGLQASAAYPDYGRALPPPHYGGYPGPYPPMYPGAPHWDAYTYPYGPYPSIPPQARSLRDEPPLSGGNRRLSDRIGGFIPGQDTPLQGHGIGGLPPKPMTTGDNGSLKRGNRSGPPPPPPPDAKEDPRAASGRKVSYHDMDLVAEGDVELMY